ncbi:zinc-finger domain-containing protein [Fretibacter rubidus]|uniref:zinc-finger domain-containing protein n=1 Tax=Fretibacter rubidus TaxID=570162 RepID=UPI00352BCA0A
MSNPINPSNSSSDDVVIVTRTRVACDGGGGALGHPKVWLDMGQDTQVECKYCDRLFKLDPKAADTAH